MKKIKLFEQFIVEKTITVDWNDDENSFIFSDAGLIKVDYDGDFKYRGKLFSTAEHEGPADLIKDLTKSFKNDKFTYVDKSLIEAYTSVPYNVKIAGEYEVIVGQKPKAIVRVAGFERENDDSDALYLMDDDKLKSTLGSFIVKNSDMRKLEKGVYVKVQTTKGEEAKIKRIGDL